MGTQAKGHPPLATAAEWREKRLALLAAEKELTHQYDRVNAARRRLPMVPLDKTYTFAGADGEATLLDLFDGARQLIVYHFMFDPEWSTGCLGCEGFVKSLGDLSMLAERNTRFVLISRAPLDKLLAYRREKGFEHRPWYSSFGSSFNYDFHVTLDESVAPVEYNYVSKEEKEAQLGRPWNFHGEAHGISVFFRVDNAVHHTYSSYARGVESLTDAYRLLDITPWGRQEDFEDSPPGWPQRPTYG